MPQVELPEIGEEWRNEYGNETGFVAFVDGTVVTFVSRTGMRAAVQFDRRQNPWSRVYGTPEKTSWCSRNGCSRQAFFLYPRPYKNGLEVVCPSHVPKGVRSEIFETLVAFQNSFDGAICKVCGKDATEVLGEIPRHLTSTTTMWNCQHCAAWWLHQIVDDKHLHAEGGYKPFLPDGYRYLSHNSWSDPSAARNYYDVYLRPLSSHKIQGPKAPTFFDHILSDDLDL